MMKNKMMPVMTSGKAPFTFRSWEIWAAPEFSREMRPEVNSISSGQVLCDPYTAEKARLIVREMTDLLALDLVEKGLVTDKITLTVGYDRESLTNPEISQKYHGPVTMDPYGRPIPKHAHGTANLPRKTASTRLLTQAVTELYDRIVNPDLLIRRVNLTAVNVIYEALLQPEGPCQMDFFGDAQRESEERERLEREKRRQLAVIKIHKKYGKNAILKGMNFEDGATTKKRNSQIGGHKA